MVVLAVVVVLTGALVGALWHAGLLTLLVKQRGSRTGSIQWSDVAAVPDGAKKITPQGMTWVDGRLLLAVSWRNEHCRVYSYDPDTMRIESSFLMPPEAVHTSGLAWDGTALWGVDYISNRAYKIDLEPSLASGSAAVLGAFDTGLAGTSACCMIPWDGTTLLAISDFRNSRETLLVDADAALAAGTASGAVVFTYRNEGFSQGLEYFSGHLWESENKAGVNVINKIDPERLEATRDARKATVRQFPAPSWGVEDLAWDGKHLWTSDESTFRIYRGTLVEP